MPRFLIPSWTTPHRVAAIALYKALLLRCPSVALSAEDCRSLRHAIQNKFRRNKKLQGPYQLALAFRAGYETLDRLDASAFGDTASTSFLSSLISTLPCRLTRAPPAGRLPRLPHPSKLKLACLPPNKAVLNVRPYRKVSGPRHIPILCSASGIPFLRLKKPQPESLGRVIRQKAKTRMKRFDSRILLSNYWLPIAEMEDQWDAMMSKLGIKGEGHEKWVDEIQHADRQNMEAYERNLVADRVIARKMRYIVYAETKLARKEGQIITRHRRAKSLRTYIERG